MTAKEVIQRSRILLGDTNEPYRYPDDMLLDFLDSAQRSTFNQVSNQNSLDLTVLSEGQTVYTVTDRSTLIANDVITSARHVLNDANLDSFQNSQLMDILNDGYRDIYNRVSLANGIYPFEILEGQSSYQLNRTWTEQTLSSQEVYLAYRTSEGLMIGYTLDFGYPAYSEDGFNWQVATTSTKYIYKTVEVPDGAIYILTNQETSSYDILKSEDGGKSYSKVIFTVTEGVTPDFAVSPSGCIVTGEQNTNRIYTSCDDGVTWEEFATTTPFLSAEYAGNDRFVVGSQGVIYTSDDYGVSWSSVTLADVGAPDTAVRIISSNQNGSIIASTNYGIYVSSDNGDTFSIVTGALGGNFGLTHLTDDDFIGLSSGGVVKRYNNLAESTDIVGFIDTILFGRAYNIEGEVFLYGYYASGGVEYKIKDNIMLKKIEKIELLKLKDSTGDVDPGNFTTAVSGVDVSTEYLWEQFLISQGWTEYVHKEVSIGNPGGVSWKNNTSNPVQGVLVNQVTTPDIPTIKVYPTPDTTPEFYLLKIYYMREPDPISSTSDTLELPTNAKEALKFYVAAQALLSENDPQDYQKGQIMMGLYESQVEQLLQSLKAQHFEDYEMGLRK